jgi:EmrB/QacA subfamily drug resistance transporter
MRDLPNGAVMTSDRSVRRAALVAATLASFLTPFMGSASSVAMPSIGREFSLDAVLLGWVPTSYLLSAAVFLVPFGRMADIHGRKRIFTYGIIVFTLASLFSGIAPSAPLLIGSRVLQGVGSAMIFGTGVAILTSVFPASKRGQVLGINVAAVYVGLSLGPFIGGFLTQNFGWRSIFLAIIPLGLVVVAFALTRLRGEWAEARGESFDLTGSIIYSLTLIALMYGFSLLPDLVGAGLILAGVVGLGLFTRHELNASHPVLELELFSRNRTFAFSSLAALINYSATSAVTFLLSLYLQYIKAMTPQQAGLVLIAQPIIQAALSPLAGRLSDRVEPRIVASAGMTLTATGLVSLILVGPLTPLWAIVGRLMVLGLGFALFSSPNMNAIMTSVERRYYAVASGTAGTARLVGQMLSMGITMLLFALNIGRVEITPEVYPLFLASMRAAFAVFAALCTGGIFASLARGRIRGDYDTEEHPAAP